MTSKQTSILAEMHADIKWIKESLNRKADKWTETVLKGLMGGILLWVLGLILGFLTPTAALVVYNNLNTWN